MGDVVYRDQSGRLWLVGRVHTAIRRAGETLHAQVLEQAAAGHDPRIRRVAAIGRHDPVLRERVVLVVEGDVAPADVRRRVEAAGLPVDEIVISGEPLPLDPRHRSKIDYARLRRRVG
jgi:acyl-CoA synthetase (AMP-forming)/AMP-acid ligase II